MTAQGRPPRRRIVSRSRDRALDSAIDDRTHHAYSDKEGDPHSPHHGFARGPLGAIKGLLHAHMGWMFRHNRTDQERYGKDILQDRLTMTVSRLFPLWAVLTFVVPFVLGGLLTMSWKGAVTGLVWGGLVRLFFNHHVTWSVNSICHFFGKRPFATSDQSTNNWVLALPSLGESWHHNHHVFPDVGLPWAVVAPDRPLGPGHRRLGEDRARPERSQADVGADRPQADAVGARLTGPSSPAAMLPACPAT